VSTQRAKQFAEARLSARLATGHDDPIEPVTTLVQMIEERIKRFGARGARHEFGIVAVGTTEAAAAEKHRGCNPTRPVKHPSALEAAYAQLIGC